MFIRDILGGLLDESELELLREKCPNTEIFWSVFSCIWTEYGDLLVFSDPYFPVFGLNTEIY